MSNMIEYWKNEWETAGDMYEAIASPEPQAGNTKLTNKTFPSPYEIMSKYPTPLKRYSNEANECAIRVSIALLDNNVNISGSSRFRALIKINDGRKAQPSAVALADWFSITIGRPKIYTHSSGQWQESDFINKEGLIYFAHPSNPDRGGDNYGHIDVISGGKIGSTFYPNRKIWFWEWKDGTYIKN